MTKSKLVPLAFVALLAAWGCSSPKPAATEASSVSAAPVNPALDKVTAPISPGSAVAGPLKIERMFTSATSAENAVPQGTPASFVPGQVFGTWGPGGDADTGFVSFVVSVPAGTNAIGIPLMTGPNSLNVSVRVVDADSKKEIVKLVTPAGFGQGWQLWNVALPSDKPPQRLQIDAIDAGGEFGQWLAVGAPVALKP